MILRVLLLLTIGSIGTIVHVSGNNQTRLCGDKSISIKRDDFSAKPECVCGNETLAEEDAERYYCCIPPGSSSPWRIRHTNPNIENQIFLEFHFLPPKYC